MSTLADGPKLRCADNYFVIPAKAGTQAAPKPAAMRSVGMQATSALVRCALASL
jgi:hypothetical protein